VLAASSLFALASGEVSAQNIDLVAQLDPLTGSDRYADVWGDGHYAYVGAFNGTGVAIIDISTPSLPFLVTVYDPAPGERFKDVKVASDVGYFASDNGGGLYIVDLSDPTDPSLLAQVTSVDGGYNDIHNVFVADGYLYQADSATETVKVFDVSDAENPFFVRNIVTPETSFIHDITVIGGRLFASGFGGSTYIYDVSEVGTMAPPLLGSVASGANSHSNWATSDGTILIVAREIPNGDVRIFDISDPGNPILLSTMNRTTLGIDAHSPHNPVLLGDDLLFISWYQAGLVAIDISDPANPVHLGGFDTYPGAVSGYDGAWGVYPFLGLKRVLVSDLEGGLFILDARGLFGLPVPAPGSAARWLLALGMLGAAAGMLRRESLPAND
jgi:choice-of-anchor B domain-containing protein